MVSVDSIHIIGKCECCGEFEKTTYLFKIDNHIFDAWICNNCFKRLNECEEHPLLTKIKDYIDLLKGGLKRNGKV